MKNPHKGIDLKLVIKGVKPFCFIDKHVHPKQYQTAIGLREVHSVVHRGNGMITVCLSENMHLQSAYESIMKDACGCINKRRVALRDLFGYNLPEQE